MRSAQERILLVCRLSSCSQSVCVPVPNRTKPSSFAFVIWQLRAFVLVDTYRQLSCHFSRLFGRFAIDAVCVPEGTDCSFSVTVFCLPAFPCCFRLPILLLFATVIGHVRRSCVCWSRWLACSIHDSSTSSHYALSLYRPMTPPTSQVIPIRLTWGKLGFGLGGSRGALRKARRSRNDDNRNGSQRRSKKYLAGHSSV